MRRVFVYGLMAAVISAAPVIAQQQQPGQRQPAGQQQEPRTPGAQGTYRESTPSADNQFLTEMAMGNMAEVELGRTASQKASSNEVKQFGQRMATDHGKALDELKKMASNKNVTLPASVDAQHKATHDKLASMSGQAFDRAYMQQMVQAHNETLSKLRSHAKRSQDADIKAWAAKTLPTVQEHLKLAQSLSGRAVGTSGQQSDTPRNNPNTTPKTDPNAPPRNEPSDANRPPDRNR
jgi:putative membrane protein